jgi:hypothetical protein
MGIDQDIVDCVVLEQRLGGPNPSSSSRTSSVSCSVWVGVEKALFLLQQLADHTRISARKFLARRFFQDAEIEKIQQPFVDSQAKSDPVLDCHRTAAGKNRARIVA